MAASNPACETDVDTPAFDPASFDVPVFAATITPHRSLSAGGRRLVLILITAAMIVATLPFLLSGAWPIAGFGGLDVLALYIAFRINARDGEKVEEVVLSRAELVVRRAAGQERREWRLNPLWTRLERTEDPEFGTLALTLASRRTRLVIGSWLSPQERASLGDALAEALVRARRG